MTISTYAEYQNLAASEKVGLVVLEAGFRLMGWIVHSGSVYKITSFDHQVIASIEDSGVAYTSVGSIGAVVASTYFHDRANRVLYLRASDSSNPNSRYLIAAEKLFFSNFPVKKPWDLDGGFEVEWLPLLESTSDFGVEVDNQNQIGNAIEGSGTVSFFNDQSYWQSRFDTYFFESQKCYVYSWNPGLPIAQAKLIFRGQVQAKSWGVEKISFTLKDQFFALRSVLDLPLLGAVAGAKITPAFENYRQRRVYGRVYGHRTQNFDQAFSYGYPVTGTVAFANDFNGAEGTGTQFLKEVWQGDQLTFDGTHFYAVYTTLSDTTVTISMNFLQATLLSPITFYVKSERPRRWQNRKHLIAGHILRAPTTTISSVESDTSFTVADGTDFQDGDYIQIVGKTDWIQLIRVDGNRFKLVSLIQEDPLIVPAVGNTVNRHAVQAVYFNSLALRPTDYTVTNSGGLAYITLSEFAEFQLAPVRNISGTAQGGGGSSRVVTGTGTKFNSELRSGDWIASTGTDPTNPASWYEIIDVTSDTSLTLRTTGFPSGSSVIRDYKRVDPYKEGTDVISVDCNGISTTGTTAGVLILTGPEIVSDLLSQAGLGADIASAAFATAKDLAPYPMSLVIPTTYNATTLPIIRDVITIINKSLFGALVMNADFQLEYAILSPERAVSTITKFVEHDVLTLGVDSTSANIIWQARTKSANVEHDPASGKATFVTTLAQNLYGQFVAKSDKEIEVLTCLVNSDDGQLLANRYAFLMELGSSQIKIDTKLRASRMKVTDKVEVLHQKMFYRIGALSTRRVGEVQLHRKSVLGSRIELEDLTNAMVRCGLITGNSAPNYAASSDTDKLYSGYITDQYGLIANAALTYNTNLQW